MSVSKVINVHGGILIAHDGSRHAEGALRTAVRLAVALKTHVTVARAWNLSTAPRPESWRPGYMPPMEDFEAATLADLDRDLAAVRAENPGVTIAAATVNGSPAEKLVEASGRVDLIVLGSRGLGGFAGMLLGSVSEQVVRHASCPVLVDKVADDAPLSSGTNEREFMEQALASELKLD